MPPSGERGFAFVLDDLCPAVAERLSWGPRSHGQAR